MPAELESLVLREWGRRRFNAGFGFHRQTRAWCAIKETRGNFDTAALTQQDGRVLVSVEVNGNALWHKILDCEVD